MQQQEPIGLLLAAVRRRIKQAVGARVGPYRLTPQQFWLLVGVCEHEGLSLRGLAERLRMDSPTASRIVSTLMRKNWVRIEQDPSDRRRARLVPTAAGVAMGRRLVPLATEVRATIDAALPPRERASLRTSLRKIITHLDGSLPKWRSNGVGNHDGRASR